MKKSNYIKITPHSKIDDKIIKNLPYTSLGEEYIFNRVDTQRIDTLKNGNISITPNFFTLWKLPYAVILIPVLIMAGIMSYVHGVPNALKMKNNPNHNPYVFNTPERKSDTPYYYSLTPLEFIQALYPFWITLFVSLTIIGLRNFFINKNMPSYLFDFETGYLVKHHSFSFLEMFYPLWDISYFFTLEEIKAGKVKQYDIQSIQNNKFGKFLGKRYTQIIELSSFYALRVVYIDGRTELQGIFKNGEMIHLIDIWHKDYLFPIPMQLGEKLGVDVYDYTGIYL